MISALGINLDCTETFVSSSTIRVSVIRARDSWDFGALSSFVQFILLAQGRGVSSLLKMFYDEFISPLSHLILIVR